MYISLGAWWRPGNEPAPSPGLTVLAYFSCALTNEQVSQAIGIVTDPDYEPSRYETWDEFALKHGLTL